MEEIYKKPETKDEHEIKDEHKTCEEHGIDEEHVTNEEHVTTEENQNHDDQGVSEEDKAAEEPEIIEILDANDEQEIDYKTKFEEAEKSNDLLTNKLMALEIENMKNLADFKEQAKGFQAKAQIEINKVKEELRAKFSDDSDEAKKYGSQKVIETIAPTLFNLDLAVKSGLTQGHEVQAYVKGFEMLLEQLYTGLESNGVEIIEPNVGKIYDPVLHEAFSKEEGKANTILVVKKKGIKLHDRVLIPSSVIIGK